MKALITILVSCLPIYTSAQSTKTVNPKIVESVKGESDNIFFGSYLGLGANFVPFLKGSVGVDMVAAVSPKFAVGTFVGYQTVASGSFGINFIFGEHTNQDAFYLGFGANVNGDRGFFLTRIGARSSRRRKLFPFVELGLGNGGYGGIFRLIWAIIYSCMDVRMCTRFESHKSSVKCFFDLGFEIFSLL